MPKPKMKPPMPSVAITSEVLQRFNKDYPEPPQQSPLPLPLIPRLDTLGARRIACTSLRPGDWLAAAGTTRLRFLVLKNYARLSLVVVWTTCDSSHVYDYMELIGLTYVGRCRRREWRKFLPRFLRRNVCKYSQP